MVAMRISYSSELEDTVVPRNRASAVVAAVQETVSVLGLRFAEVQLFPAWAPAEEGAEIVEHGTVLRLTVLPVRFADSLRLKRFLCHELGHVADIIDSAFGYGKVPEDFTMTPTLRRQFKLLWACSIDGHTARLGGSPLHTKDEYEIELARQYAGLRGGALRDAVSRLWDAERPSYCCLVRMAAGLSVQPAAGLLAASQIAPGLRVPYAASMA